ncbi:MAG: hypothetical protein KDE68_08550 [Rhodocyclaceae bacterium]|nr:hypothetical protein [Rhodocyclaceae bacterium]
MNWLQALLLALALQFSLGVQSTHAFEHLPGGDTHRADAAHLEDPAEHAADLLCVDCVATLGQTDVLPDTSAALRPQAPDRITAGSPYRAYPGPRSLRARNRSPPIA